MTVIFSQACGRGKTVYPAQSGKTFGIACASAWRVAVATGHGNGHKQRCTKTLVQASRSKFACENLASLCLTLRHVTHLWGSISINERNRVRDKSEEW